MKKHNLFARVLTAIIVIAMAINCNIPLGGNVATVKAADTKSALTITEEMGVGWNLGNSLDAHGNETAWGNPTVTRELITTVKNKGFNTIRIPVTWCDHITTSYDSQGKEVYTIDQAWMNRVEEVVNYAYGQGMYVILNIHHEDGYINRADLVSNPQNAYSKMSPYVTQLWTQIATRFKDYDQHLIFEGMNEPRQKDGDSEVWYTDSQAVFKCINDLNEDFVRTVRGIDSNYNTTRLLMIPSYAASADTPMYDSVTVPKVSKSIDSNNDGRDDYIAISIHAYKPYDYTMNSEGDHSKFTPAYDSALKNTITSLCDTYVKKGIPVVIGEFSASNYGYDDARVAWAEAYMTYAKKCGIPCVLWDNNVEGNNGGEAHGYVNRSNNTWYTSGEKVVNTLINTYKDSSIEWRFYVNGGTDPLKGPDKPHNSLNKGTKIAGVNNSSISEYFAYQGNIDGFTSGKELAIKYSDKAPMLELMDAGWNGWTQVGPEDVDEINKIAYYSYDYVMEAWGKGANTLANVKVTPYSSQFESYLLDITNEVPVVPPIEKDLLVTNFSLIAGGNIGINFFIQLPQSASSITVSSNAAGSVTKYLSDSDKQAEYKISYTVPAKDMGEAITITVYGSDGSQIAFKNTANVANGSFKMSVSQALERMMNDRKDDYKLVDLAKAMYSYGAVSAAYFGKSVDWANIQYISGSQQYADSQSKAGIIIDSIAPLKEYELSGFAQNAYGSLPIGNNAVEYLGASLILEDDVTVRHYFTGAVTSQRIYVNGAQVYAQPVNGQNNLYYVEVKNISPVDFDKNHTIAVGSWTMNYSAMTYGNKIYAADGNKDIKAVVAAMYNYMKAAENYFNN